MSKKDEEERNRLVSGSHGNGLLIKQALFIFHGSFYGRVLFDQRRLNNNRMTVWKTTAIIGG